MPPNNTDRRTFRGRGRTKDGNLPQRPHRRNQNQAKKTKGKNTKYADDDKKINDRNANRSNESRTIEEDAEDTNTSNVGLDRLQNLDIQCMSQDNGVPKSQESDVEKNVKKEIKDLKKRIFNIRESMQLSADALSNPSNWENNSLNAVGNCCKIWRAILDYYFMNESKDNKSEDHSEVESGSSSTSTHSFSEEEEEDNKIEDSPPRFKFISEKQGYTPLEIIVKEVSVEIYGLVQMAMQTGPLVGSSAGYFKRCGAQVAQTALEFLNALPLDEVLLTLSQIENGNENENENGDACKSTEENHRMIQDRLLQNKSPTPSFEYNPKQKKEFIKITIILPLSNLCFSDKQLLAINNWRSNARKAVKKNGQPSKSMLKKQNQFEKEKKKKRKGKSSIKQ